MKTYQRRVLATSGKRACHSADTTLLHHRDFPEIWAEGTSLVEAATHLANMLSLALESSGNDWRRVVVQQAVDDVAEFIDAMEHDDAEGLSGNRN